MIEFVLVLTLCSPGAWNNCSGDIIKVERIEHLPSKEDCLSVKKEYEHIKYSEGGVISAICIPQVKK